VRWTGSYPPRRTRRKISFYQILERLNEELCIRASSESIIVLGRETADEGLAFVILVTVARAHAMDGGPKNLGNASTHRAFASSRSTQFHARPKMSQTEKKVHRTIKGNKFTYDGVSHTINGYPQSSRAAISEELRRQPVVAYLKAQRIFWGWSLPDVSNLIYKHEMIEELERFCVVGELPPVCTPTPDEDHRKPQSYQR